MNDPTSRVAVLRAKSDERHAVLSWLRTRRNRLNLIADAEGTYADGYAAAMDDVENILLVRDQRL